MKAVATIQLVGIVRLEEKSFDFDFFNDGLDEAFTEAPTSVLLVNDDVAEPSERHKLYRRKLTFPGE